MKKLLTGANCKLCINNVPVPAATSVTLKIGAAAVGTAQFSAYDIEERNGKRRIKTREIPSDGPGKKYEPIIKHYEGHIIDFVSAKDGKTIIRLTNVKEVQNGPDNH